MADDIIAQMQADAGQSSQAPQSIIDQMRADAGIEQAVARAKYDAGSPGAPLQIHVTGTGTSVDKPIDPSEGGSTLQLGPLNTHIPIGQGVTRFLAGTGKAFEDAGRGIGNIVTDAIPAAANLGFSTRADTDQNKKLDAPLMNTGSGIAGNILGNVAAYAPLSMIPGAATIGGGAALGAASGALQPVGTGDSRSVNAVEGGALGAAVPSAVRLAKTLRAGLVDPFTDAGRTKIAGSLINRAAADPSTVADNLGNASAYTPGFQPTVGQAAGDDGVAALQRTMEAVDPAGFNGVRQGQTSALADALRGIAGNPEQRSAAESAMQEQAKNLYGDAFKENLPVTPELIRLMSRPSMRMAESRAQGLASELSIPFQASLSDMRPKQISMPTTSGTQTAVTDIRDIPKEFISVPPTMPTQSSFIKPGATRDMYSSVPVEGPKEISASDIKPSNWDFHVPGTGVQKIENRIIPDVKSPGWSFEVPPVDSIPVRDAHTIKMAMDALLKDPTQGLAGRESAAIAATREKFLDMLPDSYQAARIGHIEANKPINQMDIGQELYNRFIPALSDASGTPFKARADALATALRNGDQIAKNVTGLKNATMEGIMTPEQMSTLNGVVKDSAMRAAMDGAGRGAGSDTVQKISMSNIAAQAGVPNWLSTIAKVPGGWAKRAGDILYQSSDTDIRNKLSNLLRDPQAASAAMKAAGASPSQIAQALRAATQGATLAAPATIDALQ